MCNIYNVLLYHTYVYIRVLCMSNVKISALKNFSVNIRCSRVIGILFTAFIFLFMPHCCSIASLCEINRNQCENHTQGEKTRTAGKYVFFQRFFKCLIRKMSDNKYLFSLFFYTHKIICILLYVRSPS